jgi:ribosomal peptide maturation radical SAM protein 1
MMQEENRQLVNQIEKLTPANKFRVALICMPFAAANRPSIQIGLLKAIIDQAGFNADTYHLNLELAAQLHLDNYSPLCEHRGHMTGEWLFSVAAFGEKINLNDSAYFAAFPDEVKWIESIGKNSNFLSQLRHDIIPRFISECATMVDWSSYDLIAFSSTFQQNVASLALASRIKEKFPEVKVAFGGANMEGDMGLEYARAFPFVDYVMVGEGDVLFPSLLNALALGKVPESMPGLITRSLDRIHGGGQAQPIHNLDSLPTPNYEEYFDRAKRLDLTQFISPLPFESSRGCWWGQKSHCTFCGLNGFNMSYRSKSTQRVLRELSEMAVKYRINTFEAVDNILDVKYVENFFSEIQATKTDYQFFYEIKANLNHNQIRSLYLGGVRAVQPGIESLNSHILKLMRKGTTMLLNVRLLKWCQYHGINVAWNLLWGFPGETEDDYLNELKVLKLISHLSPPIGSGRIWMERFSPYFVKRDEFPIKDLRPEESYNFAYPHGVDLEKIAYFFDYNMEDTLPDTIHEETRQWIDLWKQSWGSNSQDTLFYRRTLDALFIDDKRGSGQGVSHAIYGSMALIYEYCSETMRSASQVLQHLALQGYCCPNNEVVEALNFFCQSGVMLSENGQYLSLALPANPNW